MEDYLNELLTHNNCTLIKAVKIKKAARLILAAFKIFRF